LRKSRPPSKILPERTILELLNIIVKKIDYKSDKKIELATKKKSN
jgi:hypothetical protein